MIEIIEGLGRLAVRFRRVADRGSDEYGHDEYINTCAEAFILFEKLKTVASIPLIQFSQWITLVQKLSNSFEDGVKTEKMRAFAWEAEMQMLCSELPENSGLPSNPMLWKQAPNGNGLYAKGSEIWRSKAENMASICDWLAENIIERDGKIVETDTTISGVPRENGLMRISDEFLRQSDRFRNIARNATNESGPKEYENAAAAAFGLFMRLKEFGSLPFIDLKKWRFTQHGKLTNTNADKMFQQRINAGRWADSIMRVLCEKLPQSCGMPTNPLAYENHPGSSSLGSMNTRWRPLAENSARICDWIAKNASVNLEDDSNDAGSTQNRSGGNRGRRGRPPVSESQQKLDEKIYEVYLTLQRSRGLFDVLGKRFGITSQEARRSVDRQRKKTRKK